MEVHTPIKRLGAVLSLSLFVSFSLVTSHWSLVTDVAFAQIPSLCNYQGRLTEADGTPVTGQITMTFRLYDASTSGSEKWKEDHTISLTTDDSGIFNVILGSVTSLSSVDFNSPLWLSVQVSGDTEMSPRQRMTAVGYAMNADKLDSLDSSSFLRTDVDTSTSGKLTITRSGTALVITPTTDPSANTKLIDVQNAAGTSRFSVDLEGDVAVAGDLAVTGTISGSTSTTGTTSTTWTVDSDNTSGTEPASGAGLVIEGGSGDVSLLWDATNDELDVNKSVNVSGNAILSAQGDVRFADSDSSNYVALQAPSTVSSNVTWTMPSADGSANQVLQTDGAGALAWATVDTSTSNEAPTSASYVTISTDSTLTAERTLTAGGGLTLTDAGANGAATVAVGAGTGITVNADDVALDTPVSVANGGTGLSSYTTGDLLYASATNTLAALAKGTDGQVLKLSSGLPSWGTDATGGGNSLILDLADDGTNESTALGEVAITNDTNAIFSEPTADKLLIDVSQRWPAAGALKTGTGAGNTALLQAYDTDTGPGYVTFATLTAGTTPTFDLASGTTLGGAAIQTGTDDDVPEAGDYTNLTGGTGIGHAVTGTLTFDATELGDLIFGAGGVATMTHTFSLSGATDPVWTIGNNAVDLTTGVLKVGGTAVSTGAHTPDEVGTLTANKWCVANSGGTAIDCATTAPETEAQIGTTDVTGNATLAAAGQAIRATGNNTAAWGALDLADTDAVTGTLAVGNGGTGTTTATGTAGSVVLSNSPTLTTPTVSGNITYTGTQPKRTIVLTGAGAIVAPTAGNADQRRTDDGTNNYSYYTLNYDQNTDERATWQFVVPDSFAASSDLTVTVYWTSTGGTVAQKVDWEVSTTAAGDDDPFASALDGGTADVTINDALLAVGDLHATAAGTISAANNNWAAGKLATLRVVRDADDATNDTLAADVQLLMVKIEWTASAESD